MRGHIYTDFAFNSFRWTIARASEVTFTEINGFEQPNTTVLSLHPGVLTPGEYIVSLRYDNSTTQLEDSIVVKVVLPDLVSRIHDAHYIYVSTETTFTIDASRSCDPAEDLPSVANEELIATWFVCDRNFNNQTSQYSPPYSLTLEPADHGLYREVVFTLTRGNRRSNTCLWLSYRKNGPPINVT